MRKVKQFVSENTSLLQSALYLEEIARINSLFRKHRLQLIFLKGLPLHMHYDGRIPHRIYADCDVLIDRMDFCRVKTLMQDAGYTRVDMSLSPRHRKFKRRDREISFQKIVHGFPVVFDIHLEAVFLMTQIDDLNLLYSESMVIKFTNELLRNTRAIKINRQELLILSPEYLFLYLSLHFFHHNFKGFFRLRLIYNIISTEDIDYAKVAHIILKYRLKGFFYPTILFLEKYFDVKCDKNFLNRISPSFFVIYYIKRKIQSSYKFDENERLSEGIGRFILIYITSQASIYRKICVLYTPQVLYSLYWVILSRITKIEVNFPSTLQFSYKKIS